MSLRSTLVGIIAIDPAADDIFLLWSPAIETRRRQLRLAEFGDNAAYAVVAADVTRLREELDLELRRLQARLAA